MTVSVLLVSHCEIDRLGFIELFHGTDLSMSAHAWTPHAALSLLSERRFDLVILDHQIPDCDPIQLLIDIRSTVPGQRVVMLSLYENPAAILHASNLGATGYIVKADTCENILSSVYSAAQGMSNWSKDSIRRVSASAASIPSSRENGVPLTLREGEVLERMIEGHTNKQIAQSLGISYETVKEHVQHILRKIGVNDRTQAAVWAVRKKSA